ncbi:MAG: protein kinase [Lachnospiraceae bacterium]|nr:protein kinase [Lachnospiraceae bacterium]
MGKELGRGAFGHVYEIYRDDVPGKRMVSALKVMHIPKEDALRTQMELQPDTRAVRAYFSAQIERMREEIRILKKCRGHSNIVSYEEHMIVEESGNHAVGWDILIRMERLYPVTPRTLAQGNATQYDVLRMWRDIANALIFCEEQNIIHRDVKPANILLSETGSYKLTDFGVARELMEQDQEASTRVGTEPYMAPEVYAKRNQKYDRRADIYSLGRVIYYYLNQNRHAFLPPYPQEITAEDVERAELLRLGGEKIPKLDGVSKEINDLLLSSLAFKASNRPKSARGLYREIEKILREQGGELKRKPLRAPGAEFHSEFRSGQRSEPGSETGTGSGHWSKSKWAVFDRRIPAVAAVCLTAGVILIGYSRYTGKKRNQYMAEKASIMAAGTSAETQWIPETEALMLAELLDTSGAEAMPETPDASEAETMPEVSNASGNDAMTETTGILGNDAVTEVATASEVETMTEVSAALETERLTETPDVSVELQEEPESELSKPSALIIGQLESPKDGEAASSTLKVKGWVLVNEMAGELSARAELSLNGEIVKSEALELTELSEKLFRKRQRDYQTDIAAVSGYEVKKTLDVTGLEPGTYELLLCIEGRVAGDDKDLQDADSGQLMNDTGQESTDFVLWNDSALVVLTEPEASTETETEEALCTSYQKDGYAIGLDLESIDQGITANKEQILVSGWMNAPEETSLSMVYVIDSVSYIRSTIEEAGGSVRIIRAKRNLEKMDSAQIGESVLDMEESGFLILLSLPFLEDGTHTLQLSPNVGLKETGEDAPYDFDEFPLIIDSTIPLSEITEKETGLTAAAEAILSQWAAEFPEEEEMTEEASTSSSK